MARVTEVRLQSRKTQENYKSVIGKKSTKKNKRRRVAKGGCAILDNERDEEDDDSCAAMYAAAQDQMKQEMIAAGLEGSLPMGFGARSMIPTSRTKYKRSQEEATQDIVIDEKKADTTESKQQENDVGDSKKEVKNGDGLEAIATDECEQIHSEESLMLETTTVNKVRVVYDSDGEVAAQVIEQIEMRPAVKLEEQNAETTCKKSRTRKKKKRYPVPQDVVKFYLQRHILFDKFEDGIQLDHESWYSVTPQAVAEHIAMRLCCDVVVDPFAGCGGNVIQLAMTCKHVIAIDIDPVKIRMAKHNAAIYGVADKIEWVVGNSIDILQRLKADAVFLSPPWGGVMYNRKQFQLKDMLVKGVSGLDLFARARKVSKNIAYYLPRSTCTSDLEALTPREPVECERIFLNKQLKVLTAYYGDLAAPKSQVEKNLVSIEDPITPEKSI
ncbi:unnamed protein product [Peronospora belbahrii]|uniref:Trimethylguanosine synthase n=1 Tax=Peronospora belbahrii TaxID=622444 RepID=A0AAU9LBV6_9STRA|nr:unnamed protein product [Peronospora belbahrii]CAH0519227.1 unnamed protein product [Peronospora belbahrii]